MKKRLIFLLCFSVSLLMNIIPLFVFKERIAFCKYSYYSFIAMILIIANGIMSYFLRHKKNYLQFGTSRIGVFGPDRDFTFTEEYSRKFFWQFTVYWFSIPFYIPCMFFGTKPVHSLWTVGVIFAPQIIFIIYSIISALKDVKENRSTKQKQEQELKEQQQREELGHFK